MVYEAYLTRTNPHAVQCTNHIKNTRVAGKNCKRLGIWRKERSHQYLTPKISERELLISTLGASWRPTMKKSWSPDTSRRSAKLLPGTCKKEQKQKITYERMVMKYHTNSPAFIRSRVLNVLQYSSGWLPLQLNIDMVLQGLDISKLTCF